MTTLPANEWTGRAGLATLTEALGKGLEAGGNPDVEEALELLMRLNNDLAAALLADETISPVLYPLDESCQEYDYEAWADSYVFGAGLAGDWYELAGKHADDLSELLEPLFLLNGMLKEDAEKSGERWFPPAEEARLVADIQENLPVIVVVAVDHAWGIECASYKANYGPDTSMPGARWSSKVRLDKTAESLGAHGEYVERAEDIAPAMERALASGRS